MQTLTKISVLAYKTSHISSKLLRDELQEILKEKIGLTRFPEKIRGKVIRYGNSSPINVEDYNLNSPEFIKLCSNKLLFSRLMNENEIYTPIYRKDRDLTFPLLVRTNLSLSRGRGISIIKDEDEFNNIWKDNFYWTPYIFTQFELRVHILGGEIKKIFKKIPINDLGELPLRNNEFCHFSLKDSKHYPKLKELVGKFSSLFGENFYCALDIGWDANKKDYFIFEANSAPGLNANTVKLYAEFISNKILESGN